jgi:hypothetical protein
MKEQRTGTLESFHALMIGEEHKSYKNNHGKTMFNFIGTFDGEECIFSSTKNIPSWKPPVELSYTYEKKEGNKYPKVSGMKPLDESGKPREYKDHYNDPHSIRVQAMGCAIELSLKTFYELGVDVDSSDDIDKLSNYYYKYIIRDITGRDDMYVRQKALSNSIDSIKFEVLGLKVKKASRLIIGRADHYISLVDSVQSDEINHA